MRHCRKLDRSADSPLHQLGQNAPIQKKRDHANVNDPVFIRQRLRIAPCDNDLPETVSAALQGQLLLLGLFLRVKGERRLDVNLVIAAIDDEVYLMLARLLDAVLSRGNGHDADIDIVSAQTEL